MHECVGSMCMAVMVSMDIGVYESTVCVCVCVYNFNHQRKGHCKLNIVHFLFKLFKKRHRLWRWQQSRILMSNCICVGDMKQLNKKCIFKTLTHKSWTQSAGASVVCKNQVKVPHWVQSTFLYTISGVQFLLELKHSEKPQGQLLIASEKHYFYVSVCPKMNVLEGKRK